VSKELPTLLRITEPGAGRGGAGGGAGAGGARGGGGGRGGQGGAPAGGPAGPPEGRGAAAATAPAAAGARGITAPRAYRPEGWVEYGSPYDFMTTGTTTDGVGGMTLLGPPWSQLTAYDLNTGDRLWQVPHGSVTALGAAGRDTGSIAPRGGVVVTGGGLIFAGSTSDRKFRAYDQDNGKVLWEYELPAPQEGVPAVFQAGGRQFIVAPVGGNGVFQPRASASNPIPPAGPGQYVVFALPQR